MKITMELQAPQFGANERVDTLNTLSQFVMDNWDALFIGAKRLGCDIPGDAYAPDRIQIGETRLHRQFGVKYANGVKYTEFDCALTDEDILNTVGDIKRLIEALEKPIGSSIHVSIK